MHSAKIEKSDRLQRVYSALMTGPKTTMEIIQQANVCAVNSIISELRRNNIPIRCELIKKDRKSTTYEYSLEKLF